MGLPQWARLDQNHECNRNVLVSFASLYIAFFQAEEPILLRIIIGLRSLKMPEV